MRAGRLAADQVACQIESLAAHTVTTVTIQAAAQVTTAVINLAQLSAFNDMISAIISFGNGDCSGCAAHQLLHNADSPGGGPVLMINEGDGTKAGSNGDEWWNSMQPVRPRLAHSSLSLMTKSGAVASTASLPFRPVASCWQLYRRDDDLGNG